MDTDWGGDCDMTKCYAARPESAGKLSLYPYYNHIGLCFFGKELAAKEHRGIKEKALCFCAFCAFLRPLSVVAASAAPGSSESTRRAGAGAAGPWLNL